MSIQADEWLSCIMQNLLVRRVTSFSKVTMLLGCCSVILFAGCASRQSQQIGDTTTLVGLQAMAGGQRQVIVRKEQISKIREMGLREIALSLGAQSGLASRAKEINDALVQQQRTLDTVYNFNALLLDHNILPPVLLEGRQTLNLADAQTIRISDRTYKVYKQARFVTTPPNWRQYLWMDYNSPDYPNVTLLPKSPEERTLWQYYVLKGWNQGIEQANIILQDSLARIKEDFRGMILYRKLLAMNMVSAPFVSHTELGVTGDASEIHIDDRVLRITALPALNINADEWKAAVVKDQQTLEQLALLDTEAQDTEILVKSRGWRPVIAPIN
jgi:defect in organelle trafficking protein DotC